MTLPVDNPLDPGNLAENAMRTLATQAAADEVTRVVVCLPTGEYFYAQSSAGAEALPDVFDALLTEINREESAQ